MSKKEDIKSLEDELLNEQTTDTSKIDESLTEAETPTQKKMSKYRNQHTWGPGYCPNPGGKSKEVQLKKLEILDNVTAMMRNNALTLPEMQELLLDPSIDKDMKENLKFIWKMFTDAAKITGIQIDKLDITGQASPVNIILPPRPANDD